MNQNSSLLSELGWKDKYSTSIAISLLNKKKLMFYVC